MSYLNIPIIKNPSLEYLESSALALLKKLQHPFWIKLEGEDQSRSRVITTLLHGNESSGIKALHKWLQLKIKPAVNMYFFIGAVQSALQLPYFNRRFLLNGQDLNRCFKNNPSSIRIGDSIANGVMQLINALQPEAVLDLHNTTSPGEAFAITIQDSPYHRRLASFFTDKLVINYLKLGSLMEKNRIGLPIVTIECGGAEDQESIEVAFNGINKFARCHSLWQEIELMNNRIFNIYDKPHRLEYTCSGQVSFGKEPCQHSDITIFNTFSNKNFNALKAGQIFGYTKSKDLSLFKAFVDDPSCNFINHFFHNCEGSIILKQDITVFMFTNNPEISKNDCICYFI